MIPALEGYYRRFALKLSDQLSSLLKVNFDMKDVVVREASYKFFQDSAPDFAFLSLYKFQSRGVIVLVDPNIIYKLSNKMLGGSGELENRPEPVFTFSEQFFGQQFAISISDLFYSIGVSLEFIREETRLDHVHYFYPDETVFQTEFVCRFGGEVVGSVYICHAALDIPQGELR